MKMVTLKFEPNREGAQSLGRNGWFHADHAVLWTEHAGAICLDVFSDRPVRETAPLILRLTAADAEALGEALLFAVTAPKRADHHCNVCATCPGCLDYYVGYGEQCQNCGTLQPATDAP